MRDTIMSGVIGGLVAGIPAYIIDQIEHKNGLTDMTYPQLASTLVMNKKQSKGIHGKIIGNTINTIGLAVSGVATSYVLKKTGRDYAMVKGLGVALIQGLLLVGAGSRLGLLEKPKMSRSHTLGLISHIIYGLFSGYLISKMQEQGSNNQDHAGSYNHARLEHH